MPTKKKEATVTEETRAAEDGAAKQLVVTEKPSVARDFVAALGGKNEFETHEGYFESAKYVVSWAVGHLLEFLAPEDIDAAYKRWRLQDLPIFPKEFTLKPKAGQKARLDTLKKLFRRKDVASVVNACDAGREGELIFREIQRFFGNEKPFKRLWLQSMTPHAIRDAFVSLQPGEKFDGLGAAAECRAESDWLIGMNATRALTKRLQTRRERTPWSVGRVQTPTLALVVDRELEILAHQSAPYWQIKASFAAPDHAYDGMWFDPDTKVEDENGKARDDWLTDRAAAEAIAAKVAGTRGTALEERKSSVERTPPPFDLTSLQREANRRYGYSASRTLQAAQRLYEEYKAITYPRTDSRCLPSDYEPKSKEVIQALAGHPSYAEAASILVRDGLRNRQAVFNDAGVSDHFALMPTEEIPPKLPPVEARVYDLVVRRFLGAFFPNAVWENIERITTVEGERFRTRARALKELGWYLVYDRKADGDTKLPPLGAEHVPVAAQEANIVEEETKPRPRITEAGLLNLMENAGKSIDDEEISAALRDKGLGTPATRAEIIESLITRGYMKRVGKALAATPKGIRLIDVLRRIAVERLASAALTGELERHLRQIERGERTRADFTTEIRDYTAEIVEHAKNFSFDKLYAKEPTLGQCPLCAKREVVEESLVYRCKGVEKEKCTFVLWKEKQGRYLDRRSVETLLRDKKTPPLWGFFSREGNPYRAVLSLEGDAQVQVKALQDAQDEEFQAPVDPTPLGTCPLCKEGRVIETPQSYICSLGESKGCHFALARKLLGRTMTREEAITYITAGKTPFLEGFISRRGRPFKAALILGDHGRHTWEFPSREETTKTKTAEAGAVTDKEPLGVCPACHKGKVVTAENAFLCAEGESGCGFMLPRTILGREMTRAEVVEYVTKGETSMLEGFISRRGRPFKAALSQGKGGKYRWKFPPRGES
jgi:DNA topoisomerase III